MGMGWMGCYRKFIFEDVFWTFLRTLLFCFGFLGSGWTGRVDGMEKKKQNREWRIGVWSMENRKWGMEYGEWCMEYAQGNRAENIGKRR
ncbi:hypothetical protein BZA77DRAFT_323790 [Pyronema omphalodes]|nr:hypothetical protein BZA77DRAFT_323790 [Pyronema omphalodes]